MRQLINFVSLSGGTPGISRTTKSSRWSLRKRSKIGADGSKRPTGSARRTARLLAFEGLENRTLLSITASVSGSTASFVSSSLSDDLYLATNSSGQLEYHDQNTTTFSTNLGGATLDVQTQAVTIDTQVLGSGGVYLEGISTGGQSLTIQAATLGRSNQLLAIQSTVDTQGGDFTVAGFTNVTFGTASGGGVTVSTRNLGGGTNYLTGASQGDSGATVTVANPDPNNPFLNNRLQHPANHRRRRLRSARPGHRLEPARGDHAHGHEHELRARRPELSDA